MDKKVIYCGQNRKGTWKASENKNKLAKFQNVFETTMEGPIHNDKVYMITVYHGYDYVFGSKADMQDINRHVPKAFHSASSARKSEIWKSYLKKAEESPEEYHVSDFCIASDEYGEPFEFGDCFSNKFNAKIIGVRLI